MKHQYSYLSVCLKKAFQKYVAIILTTVFLIMALFVVAQMIINMNNSDESRQRVKIGIVGDLTDTYMGISISMLTTIDDLGLSLEFIEMEEDVAKKALVDAEISAYVLVPDNYLYDLVHCNDVQLSFVIPSSTAASGALMRETVKIVSPLVTESEAGIFALREYLESVNVKNISRYADDINLEYIEAVLNRSDAISLKNIGIQSLTLIEYYACGIVIFFLLLFSLSCCMMFSNKYLALGRLYCSKNVKPRYLVFCEYTAYTCIILLTVLIIAVICGFLLMPMGIGLAKIFEIFVVLIPCVLMIAAMQFCIYEATGNIISGVLAQFIIAVFMGYISGCFYPYYFFPEIIQGVASVLPAGISFGMLRDYVSGSFSFGGVIICFAYTAMFLIISSAIRRYRLRRDML